MKVAVGTDEFCPKCMEWREYDDDGKCKVCGRSIRKGGVSGQKVSDEFDFADFNGDSVGEE
ncbi:MAG: hypothetical protein V1726_03380 [Methanobacteriota archaeon]